MPHEARSGKLRQKSRDIVIGALVAVLILLMFEGIARIAYTIRQDVREWPAPDWYAFSQELGWEPKPNFSGPVYQVTREFDSEGFLTIDSAQKFATDKTKVLFLGDSNTFGVTVPAESAFPERLEDLMPNINAINLGVPGYSSFQGYQMLLKKGLQLNPDIVVVSFNFNDRRYVLSAADVDGPQSFQRTHDQGHLLWLTDWLKTSYLYRSANVLLRALQVTDDPSRVGAVRLDQVPARVSPEGYRENLRHIAASAIQNKARVVFLLLKDNPVDTLYLRKGIEAFHREDFANAVKHLKVTDNSQRWFSALSRVYLGRIHSLQGRSEDADLAYTVEPVWSLHGGTPIYSDLDYNEIMSAVANEYGVELLDVRDALDMDPADYVDFCHFNADAHSKIADLLRHRLVSILSGGRGRGDEAPSSVAQ